MKFATFDIETVPNTTSLPEGIKPEFDPTSVKLGNTKDIVKITEKVQDARLDFDAALDKKMSLDPDLCEVVCFVGQETDGAVAVYPNDIIELAWSFIEGYYLEHIPLVSFNGIAFDLPVLWHQAMMHNIPVSPQMYSDLTKRYENRYHYDLMELLSTWDVMAKRRKYHSLDYYLNLFGIGEKAGEGSEVYEWWKAGEYDKIGEYCEQDVLLTAKLFERLEGYIVKEI